MSLVNQYERAYRAWPILSRIAQNKGRIKYGDLAKELQLAHHRPVKYVLEKIQSYCWDEKLPPLTILVENRKGIVGKGFTAWDIDDLGTGLQRVYAFDWNEVQNPFYFANDGTSPKEIAVALAKRTASPKEIYAKVRVRGMGQIIFRETLLRVYTRGCAFSGYMGEPLLQAAHILPWSLSRPEERLDPSNGILLSVLHHRLFDLDWIRIDEDYRIFVNQDLVKKQSISKEEVALLRGLNGKSMTLPPDTRNWPSKRLIAERYKKRGEQDFE